MGGISCGGKGDKVFLQVSVPGFSPESIVRVSRTKLILKTMVLELMVPEFSLTRSSLFVLNLCNVCCI